MGLTFVFRSKSTGGPSQGHEKVRYSSLKRTPWLKYLGLATRASRYLGVLGVALLLNLCEHQGQVSGEVWQ